MKKISLFLVIPLTIISFNGFAQGKDSTKPQQVEIKISVANAKDTSQNNTSKTNNTICETCKPDKVTTGGWVLTFLPAAFFLLLFYYFMGWLKKDGFKISDALTSCDPVTLTQQTKDAAGLTTSTTATDILPKSTSRLIAFLTGITAMVIGLCLVTYYIFVTIAGCPNPNLDDLWKVIAALGIGVIPYGANMWKESKVAANQN